MKLTELLEAELTKIHPRFHCEQIDNGKTLIKYEEDLVLEMRERKGERMIKLNFEWIDKENAPLAAQLIELCGRYL
jgi:hypothetical protein